MKESMSKRKKTDIVSRIKIMDEKQLGKATSNNLWVNIKSI